MILSDYNFFFLHFFFLLFWALGIGPLATPDSRPAGHDDSEELCEFEEELAAFGPGPAERSEVRP